MGSLVQTFRGRPLPSAWKNGTEGVVLGMEVVVGSGVSRISQAGVWGGGKGSGGKLSHPLVYHATMRRCNGKNISQRGMIQCPQIRH